MTLSVTLGHRFAAFALDLAFAVDKPGVTALFGPSGAGKSTTVSAIAGLLKPDRGRISIDGDVVFDSDGRRFVPARRRRIGYVFQDARLFPHLTVKANLEFGARRALAPPSRSATEHLVELLSIGHLLHRRPAGLSGGERQRVALGRAVLAQPRLLLFDEPLAALDDARKAEILPYFERLRDEARVPIVYVSHSLDEVTRLADDMVVLDGGTVAAAGPVAEIMARLDLFPLTGRFEAGAVVVGRIAEHDDSDHLSEVAFEGGRLLVPRIAEPVGAEVRLRIRARDVMLALEEPRGVSANNVVQGTVAEMRAGERANVDVQLDCGGTKLLASITHRSQRRLDLAPGHEVYAVIKTVTVDRRSATPRHADP